MGVLARTVILKRVLKSGLDKSSATVVAITIHLFTKVCKMFFYSIE